MPSARHHEIIKLISEAGDCLDEAVAALKRGDEPQVYQSLVEAEQCMVGAQYVTDARGAVTRRIAEALKTNPPNEG